MATALTDNILRLLRPEDRKSLGKRGMTAAEAIEKAEIKNEGDLQIQIVSYLRLHGIEPIYQRFGKKTRTKRGTPDILFAAEADIGSPIGEKRTVACAWELKTETGDQSDEQIAMQKTLTTPPNAWRYAIIRSLDEAIAELKRLGILIA
jgi:hypothetical protein